jgi:hypothetical protein
MQEIMEVLKLCVAQGTQACNSTYRSLQRS